MSLKRPKKTAKWIEEDKAPHLQRAGQESFAQQQTNYPDQVSNDTDRGLSLKRRNELKHR